VKVRVDLKACKSHGRCYMLAPEVFSEGERGHCLVENPQVPPELKEIARLGADACPEQAIHLEPDPEPGAGSRSGATGRRG